MQVEAWVLSAFPGLRFNSTIGNRWESHYTSPRNPQWQQWAGFKGCIFLDIETTSGFKEQLPGWGKRTRLQHVLIKLSTENDPTITSIQHKTNSDNRGSHNTKEHWGQLFLGGNNNFLRSLLCLCVRKAISSVAFCIANSSPKSGKAKQSRTVTFLLRRLWIRCEAASPRMSPPPRMLRAAKVQTMAKSCLSTDRHKSLAFKPANTGAAFLLVETHCDTSWGTDQWINATGCTCTVKQSLWSDAFVLYRLGHLPQLAGFQNSFPSVLGVFPRT